MPDEGYMDAAAVPVPDAGDTMDGEFNLTAVKVLIDHQRRDAGSCICDWGVDTGNLGQSHALHVWRELQAVGVTLPVPDAGDDTLRERLAEALHGIDKDNAAEEFGLTFRDWSKLPESAGEHFRARAGALLPRIREHVAAKVHRLTVERDQAREALAAIVKERNDWARRLANATDAVDAAVQRQNDAVRDLAAVDNDRTALTVRAEEAEAAVERVKALRPRTASGMIRDFVPYADLRAALDWTEATG